MIKKLIQAQYDKFKVFNPNAQRLLKANMIFGFLIPFYIIFSNTFLFGTTEGNIIFNIIYSAFHFLGNPLGFILNGFLLKKLNIKITFITGMIILVVNMAIMVSLPPAMLTHFMIFLFGFISGIGSGLYWSSRTYLTVISTNNENRNFFSGLDYIFIIAGGIITPFIVGNFIGLGIEFNLISRTLAYQLVIILALLLVFVASFIVYKGKYKPVNLKNFLKYKYKPQWMLTRWYALIMGLFHGAILSIPAIFVMNFVGNESAVGITDSMTHLIAIVAIYLVSSKSKPEHRKKIMFYGSLIFLIGATLFTGLLYSFSAIATILLIASFYLSDPTMNFPYRATFMKAVDDLKQIEKRNEFTYVVDIEQFNALGRIISIGVFFFLYTSLADKQAFIIYILFVSAAQFINVFICGKINNATESEPYFNVGIVHGK